jgi:hypothetical protein
MQLRIKLGVITSVLALAVGVVMAFAVPASAAGATGTAASSTTTSTGNKISNNNILDYATCQASGNCNIKHDKCLSIIEGKKDAEAILWSCKTVKSQQWHWGKSLPGSGNPGYRQLINGDGECLAVRGKVVGGAEVVGWKCLGSKHKDQYWGDSLSPCSVIYCNVFVNYANSNDVLSVKKASTKNGAEIVIDPYSVLIGPAADQMWL